MQTIEYWEVTEEYDRSSTHIASFTNEADARAVGHGVYRSVTKRNLILFDSVNDFENNTREKIRERALAKLTTEEKLALGLTI